MAAAGLALCACSCSTKYVRPEFDEEELVRGREPADSTFNVADLRWREFFSDSLLCNLIDSALKNNYDLSIAYKRVGQSAAYFRQSKWAYAPTLSANVNAGYARPDFSVPAEGSPYFTLGLSASWEIDIWGKLTEAKRAQLEQLLAQEASKNAVQTQIIASMASYYYTLVGLDMQKKFTEETIVNREKYLETVRALKQSAQVNEVAVLQAESQLLTAKNYLPSLNRSIRETENSIWLLMGRPGGEVERTRIDLSLVGSPALPLNLDSTGVPALLLRNRPDVIAAEHKLKASLHSYNSSVKALYPSLSITGSVSSDATQFAQWFAMPASLIYSALGGLTQPLFNGRRLRTQRNVAYLDYEIALAEFKQTVLNAGTEVSNALYAHKTNVEKIDYLTQQYEALDKAYEYSYELLLNGYATYLDVLTAQEGVFNALVSLIDAINAAVDDQIRLYRALGGGWDVPADAEIEKQKALDDGFSQPMKMSKEKRREARQKAKEQKQNQ